ncbi:2OG-Fe(II) oxygenase [Synechococcus sp. Nb3U1]|uniref:2OG-Fe(II) oxygenase n=1 Tax=Synechococcus sp. Nb3U1 TaxID=1914529 RepID=UPI001F240782|nr:2OG-Fe(II) oxygenase [Synechococcus sp. Nb3U1]MCF2972774.1 2OG-Fe(II) oxygenase [Synechococcus sp. Nb3U1]
MPTALVYFHQHPHFLPGDDLKALRGHILACPYLGVNNLNRDFVGTRGFSVAFRRDGLEQVLRFFPFFAPYLEQVLLPECNAFYLNPLLLGEGSRVDPHIDRSLHSYCKTVQPPAWVSVLYLEVPDPLRGGSLVLSQGKRQVGQIRPKRNTLLYFQGDLTHAVQPLESPGSRLSLVCEQYDLEALELSSIPVMVIESRVRIKAAFNL